MSTDIPNADRAQPPQADTGTSGVASSCPDRPDGEVSPEDQDGSANRRYPRYLVNLAVRYSSAQNYVEDYADNLSEGGLFIAGAQHHLEPLQEVTVEVELPGYGLYAVGAQVAYVLDQQGAAKGGRTPGAGLAVVSAPPDFQHVLMEYLMVLGRRKDVHVLVASPGVGEFLACAGFQVATAPPPERVCLAILDTPRVVGVVVPRLDHEPYCAALRGEDLPTDLVIVAEDGSSHHDLLNHLDRRVLAATQA